MIEITTGVAIAVLLLAGTVWRQHRRHVSLLELALHAHRRIDKLQDEVDDLLIEVGELQEAIGCEEERDEERWN